MSSPNFTLWRFFIATPTFATKKQVLAPLLPVITWFYVCSCFCVFSHFAFAALQLPQCVGCNLGLGLRALLRLLFAQCNGTHNLCTYMYILHCEECKTDTRLSFANNSNSLSFFCDSGYTFACHAFRATSCDILGIKIQVRSTTRSQNVCMSCGERENPKESVPYICYKCNSLF